MAHSHSHFKGKEAIEHVVEAQAKGIISSSEIHGTEVPGPISAGADAARETAVSLLLIWTILSLLYVPLKIQWLSLIFFTLGWLIWKTGRSAWLGWSRLERLHRVIAEEKWEIEHHRQQEREELRVLYAAKGFEGKLLEDVLDVLMADNDRLLRVMLSEEMGMPLETHEHPLKQALGAAIGTILAAAACALSIFIYPSIGCIAGSLIILGAAAAVSAIYEKNRLIPAIVWNIGLGVFASGSVYFLLEYILG